MKKQHAMVILLLWAVLTGFAWFSPAKAMSDSERRPLAQMPEITVDSLSGGKFMGDFEKYALDQFPLRDGFRTLKSLFHQYVLGHKDNNGIYLHDGYAAKQEYPLNLDSVSHAMERLNHIYNNGTVDNVEIAMLAQYAENKFFGKPCGLMDQMACSVGSFVKIDFKDNANPVIEPVAFDFASCGHSLVITDTRANHADLTDEYGFIRTEMEKGASVFGGKALRDVEEDEFCKNLALVREKAGDRSVLRGLHFYGENNRVEKAVAALESGDFEQFKAIITESGFSSYMYNQNVFSAKQPLSQPVSVALAASDYILRGKGAWRVHGGGFAGTIQAFVPNDLLDTYKSTLESIFGEGACYVLNIRPIGGTEIK